MTCINATLINQSIDFPINYPDNLHQSYWNINTIGC